MKFSLHPVEELLINNRRIKFWDRDRFYSAVSFTEIIFEHANIRFVAENPIDMIAGKPLSLSGSKSIVVKELGDFLVANAAVTQLENPSDHPGGRVVNHRPTDRARKIIGLRRV